MTILEAAYTLAKSVKSLTKRNDLRKLIYNLNSVREGQIDRNHFGYVARNQRLQLYGYLLTEANRSKLEQSPFGLPRIEQEELQLISSFHNQLVEVDRLCIQTLVEHNPRLEQALDIYDPTLLKNIPPSLKEIRFENSAIQLFVEEFIKHPSYSCLLGFPRDFLDLSAQKISNHVRNFEASILAQEDCPSELQRVIFTYERNSQERKILRFITNLVALRSSLSHLNQLLFQALTVDKLAILDGETIISFEGPRHNLCGESYRILVQLGSRTFKMEVNDLVLIKNPLDLNAATQLGWIQAQAFEISRETGQTLQLDLRRINESLSAYGSLDQEA
ncbi:MAG: hypothetical protein KIT08_08520 [Anaerolineales bacterium]|nr:MAG: hypothetical protein KIT08_08520 [Anaerolineales bacterium]